jgi:DNA transposition AAA+ family ATPase
MREKLILTRQLRRALGGIEELVGTRSDQRLALVEGPSGCGKSTLAKLIERAYPEARTVRLDSLISARSMLDMIFRATAGSYIGAGDAREAFLCCVDKLSSRKSLLVLDEADNLARPNRYVLLDLVRDLADLSGARIVLLSVRRLGIQLSRAGAYDLTTFRSRLHFQIKLAPPSLDDALLFARELLDGVTFDRDLAAALLEQHGQSCRELFGAFARAEQLARDAKAPHLDLAKWRILLSPLRSAPKPAPPAPIPLRAVRSTDG